MKTQVEKSGNYLRMWTGVGIGLGIVTSYATGDVCVGMIIGVILSFYTAIVCRSCFNQAL